MKFNKNFSIHLFVLSVILLMALGCEKEFISLDSDVVNNNVATNFNNNSQRFNVKAYTKKLDPVQTSNLPIYALGVYNDPVYGKTTSSILTQLISSVAVNPSFGTDPVLDSVVITIPYFSRSIGITQNNAVEYELDSVFGSNPFKLSIFESNFFLRDFDPNEGLNARQNYFSNGSTSLSENISQSDLEYNLLKVIDTIVPDRNLIVLTDEEGEVRETLTPAIRIVMTAEDELNFWKTKIFDKEGQTELSNRSNFVNYFRGLYFKAEPISNSGNYALLNLNQVNANVTLFYNREPFIEGNDRDNATFSLNFNGNRVNLIESTPLFPIPDGNPSTGDQRLFLQGTQGSIAILELFERDENGNSQLLDQLRETFKDQVSGERKRLINEANLVVHVDAIGSSSLAQPQRLYLYDLNNKRTLLDYFLDTNNNTFPEVSILNHLGPLEKDPNASNGGKYKFKITQHINNILFNDSTNVRLGLAVSGNVNLETGNQYAVLTNDVTVKNAPVSTIITPRSTVLHGSQSPVSEKRLYLEIFYTEPEN
ncbi:DUF4270 domain-containing protein [Paucihalobacter ruber]|uniref:DUF4270 domain-containing protein n=1 Tax=Paucihalobacter ruber TaxID=2567861 RepID=A0A506PLH2_9FLAO|nr:DUF4270 domain-containing protein [Paucihalobacter ruber]TPV34726.1 DUF4270 domain-containing protein [Paucihalobacter ruber]